MAGKTNSFFGTLFVKGDTEYQQQYNKLSCVHLFIFRNISGESLMVGPFVYSTNKLCLLSITLGNDATPLLARMTDKYYLTLVFVDYILLPLISTNRGSQSVKNSVPLYVTKQTYYVKWISTWSETTTQSEKRSGLDMESVPQRISNFNRLFLLLQI